jgi:hypothetical protein
VLEVGTNDGEGGKSRRELIVGGGISSGRGGRDIKNRSLSSDRLFCLLLEGGVEIGDEDALILLSVLSSTTAAIALADGFTRGVNPASSYFLGNLFRNLSLKSLWFLAANVSLFSAKIFAH